MLKKTTFAFFISTSGERVNEPSRSWRPSRSRNKRLNTPPRQLSGWGKVSKANTKWLWGKSRG